MSNFIRKIGGCAVNSISFTLYENKDGSATVRPEKNGTPFPRAKWITFESLEAAEKSIDSVAGEETEGAQRVHNLKKAWM